MYRVQCPFCGVGCGLIVEGNKVRGDKGHIATKGSMCIKAKYLPKIIENNRLKNILYRENKKKEFKKIDWDEAYNILVDYLKSLDPDEIYFYVSGQLLTEDIYVINKFVKGFLGSNNIDSNSRLCVSTAAVAYKLAFGSDGVPGCYDDIDDSDCFIFVGSNAAWCHPGIFGRVLKAKGEIVAIDPRYTDTAKYGKWIPIKPGTDTALFNGILNILYENDWIDWEFVNKYTEGFNEAIEEAKKYTPKKVAEICDVEEEDIYYLAELYHKKKKVITFWSMGVNQSTNGVMKALSIINVHLATGRLNDRGCPFSLTGQSNAMGGREVGYLSHGLPGFRDVRNKEDREFIEKIWGYKIKDKPGYSIVEAIDKILDGEIKFLWIVGTNPAISFPNLNKFYKALENVFVVVQDAYYSDTINMANLALPVATFGEREGVMTGGDRTVTYCQKFRDGGKEDWRVFTELAKRMGAKGFDYSSAREIFEEYKKLTKGRVCDISNFSYEDLTKRWGEKHLYKDLKFPSGKAKFVRTIYKEPDDGFGGLIATTGRLKKQWHTMTRTAIKELLRGEDEPYALISEELAKKIGVKDGDLIKIKSKRGEIIRKIKIGKIREDTLFIPFGYNYKLTNTPTNLITNDKFDPLSKEPELKFSKVELDKD
ncbi:molybdopterin oxidoreductase family protein [Methanocaldococcus sp.]